jgi:hypothetical protein
MKKIILILVVAIQLIYVSAQVAVTDVKYRRSSLHTILMESERFPYKDTVINAYYSSPFPEKYNDQTIDEKSFNPALYGNINLKDIEPSLINNYLTQNKIATKLVAKWFNRQPNGAFDMSLISGRGFYNANEMETLIAQKSARGVGALADAGEELVKNTFVVVSKLNFVSNAGAAAIGSVGADLALNVIDNPYLRMGAKFLKNKLAEKAAEGYSVWCTSYLFRLNWNDSVATTFYNDYWMDSKKIDPRKKAMFDDNELFKLEYIGSEKSSILITFSLKEQRSAERYVSLATIRSVDAVYAKLQKQYDVFKTKTPLFTGYPITAKIGLKEGLENNDRYEVLEQVVNENGFTNYVRKGIITVDGKQIWDNRFSAGEELDAKAKASTATTLDRTFFRGAENFYPGMLIRQIK